jgi:hypothetical protein
MGLLTLSAQPLLQSSVRVKRIVSSSNFNELV